MNEVKNKLKGYNGGLTEINDELSGMKDVLQNQNVSVKQEKDIVQKIAQLESLLPFATQYDVLKAVN